MLRWYVVQTQPNAEQRALTNLERQGYSAYLPRITRQRRHARKVETVLRPLFPRYLFVRLDVSRDVWRPILSTFGVSSLIQRGERPAPVPDGIIEALERQEQQGDLKELAPQLNLKAGEAVEVKEGPFAELIARFVRLKDNERVIVLLDLLGRKVNATLPIHAVSRAT